MVRKLPAPVALPAQAEEREERPSPDMSPSVAVHQAVQRIERPPEVKPLAPERYKIQFTVSRETHDKLRRVQDLLRHVVPNGDPAVIFEKAIALLLEALERKRIGKAAHPREARGTTQDSRHIPSAVKRAVWQRDNGRCAFTGPHGRCTETGFLEYHHVVPFADGGQTSENNLQLRCRAHNQYEADVWFGARAIPRAREEPAIYTA